MMVYEIVNWSDQVTVEADDWRIAACAALYLCDFGGQYGTKAEDGDDEKALPVFLLWSGDAAKAWLDEHGLTGDYLAAHRAEIGACLESAMVCDFGERHRYRLALDMIDDPEKRQRFREEWLDQERTSMNNIVANAWKLAKWLRGKVQR